MTAFTYGCILCDLTLLITVVVCGYGRKQWSCMVAIVCGKN